MSPGADGGAVELWISGGQGSGYFKKRPSAVPSYQNTMKLLEQWKVSPGNFTEEKNRLRIKGHGVSLGIDMSHVDCPITALAGRLGNTHWPLQTGAASQVSQNTVILGLDPTSVSLGEV